MSPIAGRRDRARRGLASLALVVALGLGLSSAGSSQSAFSWLDGSAAASLHRSGEAMTYVLPNPSHDGDVPNSGRGQYDWLTIPSQVPWLPATDIYWRDQLQWGSQIERSKGVYDFSMFERGLALAGERRARFMFRIMAYCPGCGENLTPSYIPQQPGGAPDWNSSEFLDAWERLMAALGARYGDDPRLGPIDVGGYGTWGEWLFPASHGTPITDANARRMIRAVITAFPRKFVLLNYIDPYPAMAVPMSPRVGYRLDCIGGLPLSLAPLPPELESVWRRSPVVGEWCPTPQTTAALGYRNVHDLHLSLLSSGNFPRPFTQLRQAEQEAYVRAYTDSGFRYRLESMSLTVPGAGAPVTLRSTWSNAGVAPTYDSRRVILQVRDGAGDLVWETTLGIDLRTVTADRGQVESTTRASLPAGLRGVFGLFVVVQDEAGYLPPMRLANESRQADGSYPIGVVPID